MGDTMADSLTTAQAKEALRDVARGRPARARHFTTETAKKRLSDAARAPDLMSLVRTRPLLAVTMALGYGFTLGGNTIQAGSFLSILDRTQNISVQNRTGT